MFTQSETNCALIKGALGVDRCMLECWLSHILPHAGKTTHNIPEGTAITHSAVPLMTAVEQSPQLSTVWRTHSLGLDGDGSSRERDRDVHKGGGRGEGRGPIRLLNTGWVYISDQLDEKSGFTVRVWGRGLRETAATWSKVIRESE